MKKNIFVFSLSLILGLGMLSNVFAQTANSNNSNNSKNLVVYFSLPEPTGTPKENSSVEIGGKTMGNTEYVASVIADSVNASLFRIETVQEYPIDNHQKLTDQARQEQRAKFRPELKGKIENLAQYDVIFLGYPNWWGDLPMALYSFLEQNDLSGKKIVPFCTHGGSGLSGTVNTIRRLQAKATVERSALSIYRLDVETSENTIKNWLTSIGY